MFEDKLIVTYNQKTKVLTVHTESNKTTPFKKEVKFGEWCTISLREEEDGYFGIQIIKDGSDYIVNIEGLEEDEQPKDYDIYDILNNQDITILSGKTKFALFHLKVQNGEYDYKIRSVHEVPVELSVDFLSDLHAKDFYGRFAYSDNGSHYFNGGELAVESKGGVEITKSEYNVLKKYLI